MLKSLLALLFRLFKIGGEATSTASRVRPEVARPARVATPAAHLPAASAPLPPPPPPPPAPKLHVDPAFRVEQKHRELARSYLHSEKDGKRIGPTARQEQVIVTPAAALSVLAGAGSGKSSTLVRRVLFLHKVLGIAFETIAVFTFTRKSRTDFIERLLGQAPRWDIKLTERQAQRIVRTFHSKALEVGRDLLPASVDFFEFLDDEKAKGAPTGKEEEQENQANDIEGIVGSKLGVRQLEFLREAYARAYSADQAFRDAIEALFKHSVASKPVERDEKFNQRLSFIASLQRTDSALSAHLEERWAALGAWPIKGVQPRNADGHRFELQVYGSTLLTNGFVPELDLYVVLGGYEGISFKIGRAHV